MMIYIAAQSSALLLIIARLVSHNIEEPKLINALAGADDPQPIAQLLLLEVLLGQVLEVSLGERSGSGQDELGT